ncbi:MAG: hypothetical protein AB1641_10345 [Thermodesulfobacteriota bacterium]
MKIIVVFKGLLAEWMGVARAEFDLPEPARYSDLLRAIARAYRSNMPPQLWREETDGFATPVAALVDGLRLVEGETPLADGQEVMFFLVITGG